jgi:hypothetical protein
VSTSNAQFEKQDRVKAKHKDDDLLPKFMNNNVGTYGDNGYALRNKLRALELARVSDDMGSILES